MSVSFERLKQISATTKDLINGYIRKCQMQLFEDIAIRNSYYNIPPIINNYCMLFYEVFTWYRKQCGDGIEFLSDTEVTVNSNIGYWSSCILKNKISKQICNKFSIAFKINSFGMKQTYPTFDIGYTIGNSLEESVKNWNQEFGTGENEKTSWAFSFYRGYTYYIGKPGRSRPNSEMMEYKLGDMIELVFDLNCKRVYVYHNEQERDGAYLKADTFWVGLCFVNQGATIELINYRYD